MARAPLAADGIEAMPAPCSIHDDRLRELETEQASHAAQFRAGNQMFENIQESIRMLSGHVSDSMTRVERTVDRLASEVSTLNSQVADVRVKQTTHDATLTSLTAHKEKEEEEAEDKRKTLRSYAGKIVWVIIFFTASAIAGRYGPGWMVELFKTIAGG